MAKLKDKVCLIVGASSGMGRVAAYEAGKQGAQVLVAARRVAECEAVAKTITSNGGRAEGIMIDGVDGESIDAAFEIIKEKYGRLDCAFNNIGHTFGDSLIHETPSSRWHESIATNLTAVFELMKRELSLMMDSGGGAIVNNGSTASLQGVKTLCDYTAAKWGLIGLTKTAALEYGEKNIRANIIAPGIIQTEKMKEIEAKLPDLFEQLRLGIPSARFGDMQEIADLATWLMSDEARYINGAVIPIDGGRTAG